MAAVVVILGRYPFPGRSRAVSGQFPLALDTLGACHGPTKASGFVGNGSPREGAGLLLADGVQDPRGFVQGDRMRPAVGVLGVGEAD